MPEKTALEKMRGFVESYPGFDILGSLAIDYTDQVPDNGGLFPAGLVEIARRRDILGNVTVTNQCNFALYTVFAKSADEDEGATYNAEWLIDFQQWVQEMSARRQAPVFGDDPKAEQITAQNGTIYSADEEGTAMYVIQISVEFEKHF